MTSSDRARDLLRNLEAAHARLTARGITPSYVSGAISALRFVLNESQHPTTPEAVHYAILREQGEQ